MEVHYHSAEVNHHTAAPRPLKQGQHYRAFLVEGKLGTVSLDFFGFFFASSSEGQLPLHSPEMSAWNCRHRRRVRISASTVTILAPTNGSISTLVGALAC